MIGQEITLSTVEIIFTYGFFKLMQIGIGVPLILGLPIVYLLNKTE